MESFQLPRRGFLGRMRIYLSEMYPFPTRLLSAAFLYVGFTTIVRHIHDVETSIISRHTLVGILSVFTVMLILRLMDELKDKETDRELFRDRPLPSGRVLESDISFSLVFVMTLFVVANAWLINTFWMALIVLKYSVLMFKYFFIPQVLRKHLLLNLATHSPIIPIVLVYILILFADEHHIALKDIKWSSSAALIAMFWAVFFAWEVARKIRSREEENTYVTYSQIFGRIGAVVVAAAAQSVTLIIGVYFYWTLSFSSAYLAVLVVGYGIALWGHAHFVLQPNPRTSKLKHFAEAYIFSVFASNFVELEFIG